MQQPTNKDKKELLDLVENRYELVSVPGAKKKFKVRPIKGETMRKLSRLDLNAGPKEGDQMDANDVIDTYSTLLAKAASYVLLNGFKIYLFHWVYWRYLYWRYDFDQLAPIIEAGKKKVPTGSFYRCIALVQAMNITKIQMTKEEREHFLAELSSAQKQP